MKSIQMPADDGSSSNGTSSMLGSPGSKSVTSPGRGRGKKPWKMTIRRTNATMVDGIMSVDGGSQRPSARTNGAGGWNHTVGGLVLYGGETDEQICDAETYILKPGGKGWIWEVVKVSGDASMPCPGTPSREFPKAPWGETGTSGFDTGARLGHQFTPFGNFMVLTGGMRDQGIVHNDVYVLNLDTGVWSRPEVASEVPVLHAANANERIRPGCCDDGKPTPRTGHSCTSFSHGIVMFGGFDGTFLSDVFHLRFMSGVGVLLSEDFTTKKPKVVKVIVGSSAEVGDVRQGDLLHSINDRVVSKGALGLQEARNWLIGEIGSYVNVTMQRPKIGMVASLDDMDNVEFFLRRGERLDVDDGQFIWRRPGAFSEGMSHPSWFYTSGVSGGASDSAPGPRFYHAATRLDQGLLIFGGNNGNQYKNDLYLLETFDGVGDGADAKGVLSSNESSTFIQYDQDDQYKCEYSHLWKWRVPPTTGPTPDGRSVATLTVVERTAVLLGGSQGSVRLTDMYTLDCDEWVWTKVVHPGIFGICKHLACAYPTARHVTAFDHLTDTSLPRMSVPELQRFLKDKGIDFSNAKNYIELLGLAKYAILKPGILVFGGQQIPNEGGEKKGRKFTSFVVELSSEQLKGVFDAELAATAASPLASYIGASPHRSTFRGSSPVSLGSPSPELGSRPGRPIDQVGSIVPHSPIISQPRFLPDDLEPGNDGQAQSKSPDPDITPDLKRTQPVRGGVSPIRASERSLSPVRGQMFGSDTLQMFGKSASSTQQPASETFTTDASSVTSGSLVRSYRKKPTGSVAMTSNADSVRSGFRRNTGYMSDVLAVGSNVQGYLGLSLDDQPSHPEDPGLGPCDVAHNSHPNMCIKLSRLSNGVFRYEPSTSGSCLPADITVRSISCGAGHVLVLTSTGCVFAWGRNDHGQLGLGDDRHRQHAEMVYTLPATKGSQDVMLISAGGQHSIAATASDEVFAWGYNRHGQLGLGHAASRNSPQRVEPLKGKGVRLVACGGDHTMIYTRKMEVYAFGCNDSGQIGNGSRMSARTPLLIPGLRSVEIVSIAAGNAHSACVTREGKVMTWGGSDRGQCGHGRITNTLTPTVVTGGDIENAFAVRVSCGYNTTGVTARSSQGLQNGDEEGGVWMFGAGDLGQLGLGCEGDCLLPVRVEGLRGHDAEEVSCGFSHTLARIRGGLVYGWGSNRSGQLGLGHNREARAPQMICIEEGGRLDVDNYPWMEPPSKSDIKHATRKPNAECSTIIEAGNDASFFVCRMSTTDADIDGL